MKELRDFGFKVLKKPYENALVVEFGLQRIPYLQKPRFDVIYKNIKVGEYIPDLVVYDNIVVDTKTFDQIGDVECGLDVFQSREMNDAFTFANHLQQYRACKAFDVTFIKGSSNR